jgi:hypothetical protein
MNSHRRHRALPVKIEGTKSIIPGEMQISYLLFCVVIAGDAGDMDQNGSVMLTGPKLCEVVNLLSDPLQSLCRLGYPRRGSEETQLPGW